MVDLRLLRSDLDGVSASMMTSSLLSSAVGLRFSLWFSMSSAIGFGGEAAFSFSAWM